MQIDIPAHIEKLLFLHDTLVIPGFGGFTATIASAKADFTGGTVTPPSKILTFSENLTVDDGRLVQDIANTHGIATEEARSVVTDFVGKMQALLNQREIVTLPNIGRLYKNYMQKIQFLPDATNFNASAYGLPPLQFSPLGRSREVNEATPEPSPMPLASAPAAPTAAVTLPPTPPRSNQVPVPDTLPTAPPPVSPPAPQVISPASTRIFPYVAGFLLLTALCLGFWRWSQLKKQEQRSAQQDMEQSVSSALKNTPKTLSEPKSNKEKQEPSETKPAAPPKTPATEPAPLEPRPKVETPKPAPTAKATRECILIAATLSDENNAQRLIQKLQNKGFEVYTTYKGGHQIGIRFKYSDPSEIEAKSRALQQITKEKPVLKKK